MGVMKSLFSGKQMSEAFICSAFLALSGGFQDAYTYNTRNEVFSNAQTGNVVLMSQNFMTGKWEAGLKYLFPLFAFALGVLIAEQIQHKYKYAKRLHWRQGILGERDYNPVHCRIYSTTRKYDRDCSGILCLCDAGAEFPEGEWILICEYDVYR